MPKVRLESLVLSTPADATFAVNGMLSVEFVALLPMARLPLAAPPDCGVIVTLKVVLCPAPSEAGKLRPVREKPVPEILAWLMLTLVPPELVRVSEMVLGVPTATLPKFKLPGAEVSAPAVTTSAARGTEREPESLLKDAAPLPELPACGLNVTLKAALCPAAKVTGRLNPLMVKPEPETLAWDKVTLEPPEFVIDADCISG